MKNLFPHLLITMIASNSAAQTRTNAPNTDAIDPPRLAQDLRLAQNAIEQLRAQVQTLSQQLTTQEATNKQVSELAQKVSTLDKQNADEAMQIVTEIEKQADQLNLGNQSETVKLEIFNLSLDAVTRLKAPRFNVARAQANEKTGTILKVLDGYLSGRSSTESAWEDNERIYKRTIAESLQTAIQISENGAIERQIFNNMIVHMDLFAGGESPIINSILVGGGGVTTLASGISVLVSEDKQINKAQGIALAAGALAMGGGALWEILQKNKAVDSIANAVARNQAFAGAAKAISSQAEALRSEESKCLAAAKLVTDAAQLAASLSECMSITSRRVTAYSAGADVLKGYLENGIASIRFNQSNVDAVNKFITNLEANTKTLRTSYESISASAKTNGEELRKLQLVLPARKEASAKMQHILEKMRTISAATSE